MNDAIIRLCGVKWVQGHHLYMYEPSTIAAACGNSSPNRPESPQFPSHPVDSICLIIAVVELADHTSPRRTAGAGPSSLYVVVCYELSQRASAYSKCTTTHQKLPQFPATQAKTIRLIIAEGKVTRL